MPAPGEEGAEETPEKKKRSPWTWPLIALIALLLLVLIGTIWAVVANSGNEPEPDPTKTSASPSATPTNTPTPTPTTANVVEDDYIGQDCATASAALDALGLGASCEEGNAAPDEASVGKIYSVSPTGNVPKGTIIELTTYAGQTPMPAPATPTFQGSPATVEPGGDLTVMWDGYTCPSGTGSVSSYTFTVQNGTIANGPNFPQNARNATVTAGDTAGQTVIVTYTVTCSGGTAGDRTSDASGEATVLIEAAAPTPTPTP
jgi:serine/threonine-protein kinase